eukprot:4336100-Amphidinium_carterae.1
MNSVVSRAGSANNPMHFVGETFLVEGGGDDEDAHHDGYAIGDGSGQAHQAQEVSWQALNSQDRKAGVTWMRTVDSMTELIIIRRTLEPWRKMDALPRWC